MGYQVLIDRRISNTGRELWLYDSGVVQVTSACCVVPINELLDNCSKCGVNVEHNGLSSNFDVAAATAYRGDANWRKWLKHWFDLDDANMEFS